jgi:hypothetical protein
MVNTAHRAKNYMTNFAIVLLGTVAAPVGGSAIAQSSHPSTGVAPKIATTPYRGPPPVVMFRATPRATPPPAIPIPASNPISHMPQQQTAAPAPSQPASNAPERQHSLAHQAERDAASGDWNASSLGTVIAPPRVEPGLFAGRANAAPLANNPLHRAYRGPVRRIMSDTGRAITQGLPEAIAGALPWVDREATNEPFDAVLGRVADDLHRSALGDPAWALPAQHEIRALSRRLDSLSEPPVLANLEQDARPNGAVAGGDDRPFRPRPIWPGASGRPEPQVRPVTVITTTGQQDGPRVEGVVARYVATTEDDDGNPAAQVTTPARSGARGTPVPRNKRGSR